MAATEPLSIRQLEVFVALVERRSFTGAARFLGLSQSTVSGHIADLERRLAVRLVDRARSGVVPTAEGEVLLKPARDALRAERHARMAAAELNGLLRGSLAVGGSTIPAVYVLPRLLARFREQHEGIEVKLWTGDSREILDYVAGGEVDVGLVGIEPRQRGLQGTPFGGDEVVLIAPRAHPLADRERVTLQALSTQPLVMREEGSGTRQVTLDALRAAGLDAEEHVVCQVGSTEAVKAAVRAGLGLSFVSDLAVRDEVAAGTLAVVPVEGFEVRRAFHLVTRDEERLSPAGRAFRDESLAGAAAADRDA